MKMNISPDLHLLRAAFVAAGHDLRIVGGAVRDLLNGQIPHDIDLCTDATPDEQFALYRSIGLNPSQAMLDAQFHFVETGVQHGTFTAVMNNVGYEITSLRTEANHDGRHAKMTFTKDWLEDLSRRDLTINAMAMTFDGELIDPFGGADDLKNGNIRFVGNAADRIQEDYLRILRFFRFYGRVKGIESPSPKQMSDEGFPSLALVHNMAGLAQISVERVWSETTKILAHDSGAWVYGLMLGCGIDNYTSLPKASDAQILKFEQLHASGVRDAAILMAAFLDGADAEDVMRSLKWRNEDIAKVLHINSYNRVVNHSKLMNRYIVYGVKAECVLAAATYYGIESVTGAVLAAAPKFPLNGGDLIKVGFKPGKSLGDALHSLKTWWFDHDCEPTKEELLSHI